MQESYEKIKKAYPDEWLILGDPVMSDDEQKILAADLLYHSPDKQRLAYMDKPLLEAYKNRPKAVVFNRAAPRKMSIMAGGRTINRTYYQPKSTDLQ